MLTLSVPHPVCHSWGPAEATRVGWCVGSAQAARGAVVCGLYTARATPPTVEVLVSWGIPP